MPDAARRRTQAAALGLAGALIILVAASLLAPALTPTRALLALIAVAPLAYGSLHLWRGERRAYAWMTLVVVPYLALALAEAVANPAARVWAGACVFTAFALFVALIACLRTTR